MRCWVAIEMIHNELTYMTGLTEFFYSQVQKPESLSYDSDILLMYYLIWCSRVFLYSKAVHSLAEKFHLLPLL